MKKILFLSLFMIITPVFWINYYSPDYVDKCCLVNLMEYKTEFSKIECKLKQNYQKEKQYLDSIIFKIVWIVDRKYRWKEEYLYKELAFKISDYIYNHNIQKWTESYYKLSYLAFTFYDYYLYYKNQNDKSSLDTLLENVINN